MRALLPSARKCDAGPLRHDQTSNRILSRLPPKDFGLLEGLLTGVDLPLKMELEATNRSNTHIPLATAVYAVWTRKVCPKFGSERRSVALSAKVLFRSALAMRCPLPAD